MGGSAKWWPRYKGWGGTVPRPHMSIPPFIDGDSIIGGTGP